MNRSFVAIVWLALIGILSSVPGCSPSPPAAAPPPPAASAKPREIWDVYLLQGKRIGYGHTVVRHDVQSGRPVVCTESLNHMAVKRGDETTEEDIRGKSVETPEGQLIRFESELRMGPNPIRTIGQIRGDRLELETIGAASGPATHSSIPWPADGRGPLAIEQSLWRQPMQPGERRALKTLMLGFNQIADIEMEAKRYESTPLLHGDCDLLRIEVVTRLADGQKIASTVWTDRAGETIKSYSQAMELETFRASKAEALQKTDAPQFDLLASTMVKVDRPLPNAHQTKKVRYRVSLKDGDPASVFVTGPTQAVKPIDAHTAEVTVYAIRPGRADGNRNAPADPPTDDDRRPNGFIQSEDPTIRADAQKAAGDQTAPWPVAVALEQYVHREVKNKNFTQAFATAAEVARSREGDCTEHAVLLAALARARGIPARVAMGLVYMQGAGAFGYHMWTEVYVDGRWIPIDGTLAQGGIGAAHLEIAHSNLKGASAYSAFLPVVQVLGRLRIEVLDSQ